MLAKNYNDIFEFASAMYENRLDKCTEAFKKVTKIHHL